MGEIRIVVPGAEACYWPAYMGQKLEDVIRDWVNRVENGPMGTWFGTQDPITTEHLRVAKAFLAKQ